MGLEKDSYCNPDLKIIVSVTNDSVEKGLTIKNKNKN